MKYKKYLSKIIKILVLFIIIIFILYVSLYVILIIIDFFKPIHKDPIINDGCFGNQTLLKINSIECISRENNTLKINIENNSSEIASYIFLLDGIINSKQNINDNNKYYVNTNDKKEIYELEIGFQLKNGNSCLFYTKSIECPIN